MSPKRQNREPPADPSKFREAISAWRKRDPMPDTEFRDIVRAEDRRAFIVAGVAQADVVQHVYDEIGRAIRDGIALPEFKASVGEKLADAWGGADARRVECIFRTSVLGAYNEGRHAVMTAPVVKEARPYWRLDGTGDNRQCEICDEINGTVLPCDDPFWDDHSPSFHPDCRCILVPLTEEEAAEEGGVDDTPEPENEPADGFGKAPDEEGVDWSPDTSSYDPDVAAILADRLGDAPE